MSRAYRISVSRAMQTHVTLEDGIRAPLEVLAVLPVERMRGLLAEELLRRGFEVEGTVARRDQSEGVVVEVDLGAGEVTLRIEQEREVRVSATANSAPDLEAADRGRAKLEEKAEEQLEENLERSRQRLQQGATAQLEQALSDIRGELDQVVNRVTAKALKERARQMGEIEAMSEDEETGSLTIKVRL